MQSTHIQPCVQYPGGKRRLLPHILPLIPEHRAYIEPFAGAMAVLLAKEPAKLEVVNDIDTDLVVFFRYVKYHLVALLDELDDYLNARKNFHDLLINKGWTDLQRAVRWYLLKVCSFAGLGDTFGRDRRGFRGYDTQRHSLLIQTVHERLQKVIIEQGHWSKVVDFYDAEDAFLFFDPPYINCGETAYQPFTPEAMREVRDKLDTLKGSWLLTCDDSPACRDIFKDLPFQRMPIKYSVSHKKTGKVSYELLIRDPRMGSSKR